jgi:hypothetical protein
MLCYARRCESVSRPLPQESICTLYRLHDQKQHSAEHYFQTNLRVSMKRKSNSLLHNYILTSRRRMTHTPLFGSTKEVVC